jgi:hypothetical protein
MFKLNLPKPQPQKEPENILTQKQAISEFKDKTITRMPFNCPYFDCRFRGKITCAYKLEPKEIIYFPCFYYKQDNNKENYIKKVLASTQ